MFHTGLAKILFPRIFYRMAHIINRVFGGERIFEPPFECIVALPEAAPKIGSPRQLAEEFEKADPTKAWRERIFWTAMGILFFWQGRYVIICASASLEKLSLYLIPDLARFYSSKLNLYAVQNLAPLLTAILIFKSCRVSALVWFFRNRFRLAVFLILIAIVCNLGQQTYIRIIGIQLHRHLIDFSLRSSFRYLEFGAGPLILAVWFLPKQYRKTSNSDFRLKPR